MPLIIDKEILDARLPVICRKFRIREIKLFGSALREDFNDSSDIDLLISYEDETSNSLFDIARLKFELEALFGRTVDIVNEKALLRSRNYIRRDSILSFTEVLYA